MSTKLRLSLFAIVCLSQLIFAGLGIARYEHVLSAGTRYRFETAPVDPLDLFRGRYVQLSFTQERCPLPLPHGEIEDHKAYAVLGVDDRGFAKVTSLVAAPPSKGDYVAVTAYSDYGANEQGTRLSFAFDRFYAEEHRAPELERRYRDQARDSSTAPAYALVRVLDGVAVLEDLRLQD